ncbi:alpha/beta hydrolase [Streptomyces sp. NPDC052396]|uniref:alpha/beta hydrolase n=1 Tax=Streptomyces sp. NPDC052396 TaxID=3365689 RepID=UPI0037D2189D
MRRTEAGRESDHEVPHHRHYFEYFERLVSAGGLPPIRLHDLRHGAATLMLAAGVDIKVAGTTRDPATPYPWARALARRLAAEATARFVPRASAGTGGLTSGSPVRAEIVSIPRQPTAGKEKAQVSG